MRPLSAIILAAGKGTRMNSDLPKVAHEVAGRPMVAWVADACAQAGCSTIVVVVGYRREVVQGALESWTAPPGTDAHIRFALQDEQLGTGHAVGCARASLDGAGEGDVFVLAGDGPLIRSETLRALHERHVRTGASATLATATVADPAGYGRIVRDSDGRFRAIVEHADATPEQLAIREINPSYYCFNGAALFDALRRVRRNEHNAEYYVTDVPAILLADEKRVEVIDAVPEQDVLSINTTQQLADVDAILRRRLVGAAPQETRR